ncbi:PD-(D/E)XK nuclease superfamily protein [Singulisphaera sp. GP187]|uniref:RecB family exonuclease n=1 Tax=Singulisphaera sp. GP187 TaxID=1882752 RepID=UPI00092AF31F|nr:PD-(D/E)XK nuclease family protein [Singulisphaera sp. GP187]SIO63242.1 PD-(D/E)XK nuclease superfamily protein [Singulisphaera sp. GP187]
MIKTTRPHWSYSSVSQYLKCPLQYHFERVQKLPRKTLSDAQVLGSALHSALAHYHRTIQSGDPVQAQQIQAAYLAAWDEQEARGQVVHSGDKSREDTRSLGVALVEVYLKEPPPTNIVAIEKPMLAPIANSRGDYLEKPILVVADLITRQDDNSLQVGELKTSGRSYSESEVATSLQPTFYANALYEMTGEEPAVEFTVLVKTRSPKVQKIQAIRTSTDYQRLGDLIGAVETGVEAGVFYPVESPLNCSGCAFYRPCREWTGNRRQEVNIHPGVKEVVGC